MRWNRRTRTIAIVAGAAAIALTVSLVLVLAGGSPAPKPNRLSQTLSPFTGVPVTAPGPVLAVKIDNIAQARPPTGLTDADIVYVLPVEGGLSRILAIFSSHLPPVIGPVRSAREDDLELLAQFGRPAFAFSGAQPQLLPVVERARIADLYDGRVGGYFRDPRRIAPYNLYAHTQQLLTDAPGASEAHDIGFRFSAPRPRAVVRPRRSRSPTLRPCSPSAGPLPTGAGWCPWTAFRPAPPRADSSAPQP